MTACHSSRAVVRRRPARPSSRHLAASLFGAGIAGSPGQPAASVEVLTNPEPGFFILGAKSYGRNSSFLLRTGIEQVKTLLAALGPARLVA